MSQEERINSAAISDYKLGSLAITSQRSGELAVSSVCTNDFSLVPEGWQLCEPPAPDGWNRYERKRR